MSQFRGENPLEKTFHALVASRRPNASYALAYAVLNCRAQARRIAVIAALDRSERPALEAVIRIFHEVQPDLQTAAIARADAFLPCLRQSVRDSDRRVRANVCNFLVRMDDTRVAYLLAELLQDPIEEIKKKAQEGLLALAHNYHRLVLSVESGETDIPRAAMETKRYALLDALLTAFRFYASHERPEMIAALLSLDRRGDEVLMDVLANPMDRRRKIILDILETAFYPRAVSFLLSMLKNAKTASMAIDILETRFDLDFIKALLANRTLLTNTRIGNALGNVQFVPWLRPGTQKASDLPDRLGVRAVRFLLLTGTKPDEKQMILKKLSKSSNVPLASAAKFVLTAMARQVHRDRIDAGLVKVEQRCPQYTQGAWEPEVSQLVTDRVASSTGGADLLSDETLFRNFMNSFESLARSEKDAALGEFEAKGLLVREIKRALADPDPDITLRGIKVIEYRGCQAEVSGELSVLTRHPDRRVRSCAVRQLGKAGAYDALKALFGTLSDRDRRVLANTVEALEETGHKQILRLLVPLTKHPDNRVRANAAKAAWTLGDESGRDVLVEMLRSQKVDMRLSGLWGLRQIGVREEIEAVREIAKNDPEERVRNSAEMTVVAWENAV
ncbi:MAG: HEAT repeat domain-containing protein [Planctomycetes bacterium]|nr:HEAT repeat domain-containing protein [Planctomycetota bacterium]